MVDAYQIDAVSPCLLLQLCLAAIVRQINITPMPSLSGKVDVDKTSDALQCCPRPGC